MHQSLLHSNSAHNITITGYGTIDGNGMPWWKCAHDIKKPPCNDHSRPHLVMLVEGENIEVS